MIDKIHDDKLAVDLWGYGSNPDNKDKTWGYIYFLRKVEPLNISTHLRFRGHTGPLNARTASEIASAILKSTGIKISY